MAEIQHFIHEHKLRRVDSDDEYHCQGCFTPGIGPKYRCSRDTCDFDLHVFCAEYTKNATIHLKHIHPHAMNLVQRAPKETRKVERSCTICREEVEGLFFRCKDCDFDVHTICAQLPPTIRNNATHGDHPLEIHRSGKHPCMVCGSMCMFWRYRCNICNVEIHVECIPDDNGPAVGAGSSNTNEVASSA